MKIKKWKEINHKEKEIILFTILSILLIVGVFFYQSFAIFKANTNQDMIEGKVEDIGDLEFAFYVDGKLVRDINEIPQKNSDYSLDTSSSYCMDVLNHKQISTVNWDNENWEVRVKNIQNTKTKCYLHFKKIYKETILNEAIPDLMNGRLVPVKIDDKLGPSDIEGSSGGKVTKADITDEKDPWYKYADKKWANAVILKDGKTDTYQPGEEILQNDIESYFVWIPRYQYQLQDEVSKFNSYSKAIDIRNQADITSVYNKMKETNTDGNKAKNHPFEIHFGSKESEEVGGYMVHPAFEAFNTNGLWIGKFETGYNQNADPSNVTPTSSWKTGSAAINEQVPNKVIIKPNVYSWRGINVSNAFYTSYEYKRELESHMMKNTEWGAVAYLTNSKYGRCNSNSCTEVSINNEENYITGWSTTKAPTCGYTNSNEECNHYGGPTNLNTLSDNNMYSYYITNSKGGSTTGNYTGIYDMVGGAFEYVMGVLQTSDSNKNPTSGRSQKYNSGFNGTYSCYHCDETTDETLTEGLEWPSSKYYDLYDYNTSNQEYQRGKLGDGTKELGPFYNVSYLKQSDKQYGPARYVSSYHADLADFVYSNFPWFVRGGSIPDGTNAGVFAFLSVYGQENADRSFRIVLAP